MPMRLAVLTGECVSGTHSPETGFNGSFCDAVSERLRAPKIGSRFSFYFVMATTDSLDVTAAPPHPGQLSRPAVPPAYEYNCTRTPKTCLVALKHGTSLKLPNQSRVSVYISVTMCRLGVKTLVFGFFEGDCGGNYSGQESDIITSPNYPGE